MDVEFAPDAEPRPAHRERDGSDVPAGLPRYGLPVRVRREARAARWARPTTSTATDASSCTAAGGCTTTGRSTSCVRGSFGAETWCIYYRGLDTLDLDSLSLSNMPGKDIWMNPGTCRDRRVPSFDQDIDPDIEPMKQSSTSFGADFQVGDHGVVTVHYVHNDLLETIEDIGFLNAEGDEGYLIGNPGKRVDVGFSSRRARRRSGFATPRPKRQVRRARARLQPALLRELVLQRQLHAEPSLGQLRGPRLVRRDHDADDRRRIGRRAAAVVERRSVRAATSTARGTSTSCCGIRTATSTSTGRLATDRPHVLKLYGSYTHAVGHEHRRRSSMPAAARRSRPTSRPRTARTCS